MNSEFNQHEVKKAEIFTQLRAKPRSACRLRGTYVFQRLLPASNGRFGRKDQEGTGSLAAKFGLVVLIPNVKG